jgi:chemotaxis response regulator CheB
MTGQSLAFDPTTLQSAMSAGLCRRRTLMKKARGGRVLASAAKGATDTRAKSRAGGSFTIVGIGASAGGLEAFSALLKHLPLDTGMGFVLVQHLDPEHDSALTQLLGRDHVAPGARSHQQSARRAESRLCDSTQH